MTIVRTHPLDGTAGTAVSTTDGFDVVTGAAPTFKAGGYGGSTACMNVAAGATGYAQDDIAPGYLGMYVRFPTLPSTETVLFRGQTTTGGSATAATVNPDGTISVYSSLSSRQATTTAKTLAGQWYRIEWGTPTASSQELRLFLDPSSQITSESITGAAANVPGVYTYGISWTGRAGTAGQSYDLDQITVADAWPDMGVTPPATASGVQMLINGVLTPASLRMLVGGALVDAAAALFAPPPPPVGNTFPMTFPATLA